MKRTILIIMLAFYTLLGHSQNVNHAEKIDSTEIKVKYVMSRDHVMARIITTARFVCTFIELYGDSMIIECIKNRVMIPYNLVLNNDGSVKKFKITVSEIYPKELRKFIQEHKWELLREVVSSYDYIYMPVQYTYKENLTRSRYKPIYDLFPISGNMYAYYSDYDITGIKDIHQKLNKIISCEYAPIKTSIDEGLHPDDYSKYEYNPVNSFPVQDFDMAGYHY